MSTECRGEFARVMDAFEGDLRIDVTRPRADGGPVSERTYTKGGPSLSWVPCVGAECHLGGFDLAHELGPFVFARQRAIASGFAGRYLDQNLQLQCGGRLSRPQRGSLACGHSFTVHISGTLRAAAAHEPAGAIEGILITER